MRNHGILQGDVDQVLDVYFRQCSLRVSARDLSVMAATLANKGRNPLTGEQVASSYAVARTLSVMTSSGMYDSAGGWVYRVGIPAKSGVGGGIVAALPSQLGLGTYSPRIDDQGNSVRGLRTCEALSTHFGLHMLNRVGDVQTCIAAGYDVGSVSSRRSRPAREQAILEAHHAECAILELTGALELRQRRVCLAAYQQPPPEPQAPHPRFPSRALRQRGGPAAARRYLRRSHAGHASRWCSAEFPRERPPNNLFCGWLADRPGVRSIGLLDEAIEWAEDRIIQSQDGDLYRGKPVDIAEQELLAGLDTDELAALAGVDGPARVSDRRSPDLRRGAPASSLMFVASGVVSVRLHSGVRLATLSAGMAVGEMALLETSRSADVWADTHVTCLELSLDAFNGFRDRYPRAGEKIMANLARLLAKRLIVANHKIEVLASY